MTPTKERVGQRDEYFISYGPIQHVAVTLKDARALARTVSKQTIYSIDIVRNGDVVETWKPRISKSGRVTFRRVVPRG